MRNRASTPQTGISQPGTKGFCSVNWYPKVSRAPAVALCWMCSSPRVTTGRRIPVASGVEATGKLGREVATYHRVGWTLTGNWPGRSGSAGGGAGGGGGVGGGWGRGGGGRRTRRRARRRGPFPAEGPQGGRIDLSSHDPRKTRGMRAADGSAGGGHGYGAGLFSIIGLQGMRHEWGK